MLRCALRVSLGTRELQVFFETLTCSCIDAFESINGVVNIAVTLIPLPHLQAASYSIITGYLSFFQTTHHQPRHSKRQSSLMISVRHSSSLFLYYPTLSGLRLSTLPARKGPRDSGIRGTRHHPSLERRNFGSEQHQLTSTSHITHFRHPKWAHTLSKRLLCQTRKRRGGAFLAPPFPLDNGMAVSSLALRPTPRDLIIITAHHDW